MANEHPQAAIRTTGLACGYDGNVVLQDVNIEVPRGRITCVLGGSGCGKSTLLKTLLLLEAPLAGSVWFEDVELACCDCARLQTLRQSVGVLFQGAALFNSLTLLENVAFPLLELTELDEEIALETARLKLGLVGLGPYAQFLPAEVSGGMRKRCGIARALVRDPAVLFLDEPGAGLDPITSAALDRMIVGIRDSLGTTMVVVTHELTSIRAIADHCIMLVDGRVAAQGTVAQVLASGAKGVREFFERIPPDEPQRSDGLAALLLP